MLLLEAAQSHSHHLHNDGDSNSNAAVNAEGVEHLLFL